MNNPNIVNLIAGELHFPALLPFVSEDSLFGGNMNEILSEVLGEELLGEDLVKDGGISIYSLVL